LSSGQNPARIRPARLGQPTTPSFIRADMFQPAAPQVEVDGLQDNNA
jgi:hypothetical protein